MTVRRWARGFGIAGAVMLLVAAGLVMAARSGMLRPQETEMRSRYALPNSQFIDIGGQVLHLVDEGQGPPVILVHGSFGSLRMWQGWAQDLRRNYRVIRFDRPGMGLSGPSPDGRYDNDTDTKLIDAVADRLHLARFYLVGTSSSGEAVAHYAATHPARIAGVVLANIAAGPLQRKPGNYPWAFQTAIWLDPWLGGWHLPALWRGVLRSNFADPAKVTPALVREWTDLNNRAQAWPRKTEPGAPPPFSGTPADLAAIRAPALVLWSDHDPEVPLAKDGRATLRLLGSPDKVLVVVPNCGHMLAIECSAASAAAVHSFLDRVSAR